MTVKGQNQGVPDTLLYLQNIVTNKSEYIGRPFSTLLDSLKIEIRHFSRNMDIVHDVTKESSTSFGFYFPLTSEEIYLSYPRLRILWQIPVNANQSKILYNGNNGGGWTSTVSSFYASAIIANIEVRE
ncbi:MAG: hypothetical protein EOP00_23260 [Pedobacter sp.]|nr:MAG: hypothetical protein EOP00_23260 [Pedobacter sp.]